jgi:hypothetical protein
LDFDVPIYNVWKQAGEDRQAGHDVERRRRFGICRG